MKITEVGRTMVEVSENAAMRVSALLLDYRCAACEGKLEHVRTGNGYAITCPTCETQNPDVIHVAQIRREQIEAAEVTAGLPAELRELVEEHSDPALVAAAKELLF